MKTLALTLLTITAIAGASRADLKWTETLKMGGVDNEFMPKTTHYMSAIGGRTDTLMEMGPVKMNSIAIQRCDTNEQFSIDPEAKIYSKAPLMANGSLLPMPTMPDFGVMGAPAKPKTKQTGTQEITVTLQHLGKEKILDIETQRTLVEMNITSTGCAGKGTQKIKMETWRADFNLPAPCLATSADGAAKMATRVDQSNCDVKTTMKGEAAALGTLFNGFLMRLKFGEGKDQFTKEVTMLSRAKLEADVFTIPTDYKLLEAKEFEAAKQKAMMQRMMDSDE